ncbi:MarR family winged helix-turn-helix transcriptional regulator [Salibacterium aidingense]|uniref:MarR family winged helix-turn-helix transcriptional regulator n=1 Tax=Salibacterium aidingense TaxID=384933 RepID=UPI003BB9D995
MQKSDVLHLLNQKVRLFSKELNEYVQQHELYASQWTILYVLTKRGPMTQTEIWKYLQVEAPTVTRTLTRMEKKGWVKRISGQDKRERIIVLTETAERMLPEIQDSVKAFEERFAGSLTEKEQIELYRLLEKLGTDR